jgi:hypothetical protein
MMFIARTARPGRGGGRLLRWHNNEMHGTDVPFARCSGSFLEKKTTKITHFFGSNGSHRPEVRWYFSRQP